MDCSGPALPLPPPRFDTLLLPLRLRLSRFAGPLPLSDHLLPQRTQLFVAVRVHHVLAVVKKEGFETPSSSTIPADTYYGEEDYEEQEIEQEGFWQDDGVFVACEDPTASMQPRAVDDEATANRKLDELAAYQKKQFTLKKKFGAYPKRKVWIKKRKFVPCIMLPPSSG